MVTGQGLGVAIDEDQAGRHVGERLATGGDGAVELGEGVGVAPLPERHVRGHELHPEEVGHVDLAACRPVGSLLPAPQQRVDQRESVVVPPGLERAALLDGLQIHEPAGFPVQRSQADVRVCPRVRQLEQAQELPLRLRDVALPRIGVGRIDRDGAVERIESCRAVIQRQRFGVSSLGADGVREPVERVHHVGVLLERLAQDGLGTRPVGFGLLREQQAAGRQGARHAGLEAERTIEGLVRPRVFLLLDDPDQVGDGELGMGGREPRIELDRCLQLRPGVTVDPDSPPQQLPAGEEMLVGVQLRLIGRRLRHDVRHHRGRHHVGDLALDREDVLQGPVEGVAPALRAALVHQLRRDPQAVPLLANAALQQIADAEQLADPRDAVIAALEGERRGAADHVQAGVGRQLVQDLLGDAVAEDVVLGVVADVAERQHRDGVRQPVAGSGFHGVRRLVADDRGGVEHLARGVLRDQQRDDGQRREDQVVGALQPGRRATARAVGRRRAHDALRRDVEKPAEDQRERKAEDRGRQEHFDRRVRNPPGREEHVRGLHHEPRADDVETRGPEHPTAAQFPDEAACLHVLGLPLERAAPRDASRAVYSHRRRMAHPGSRPPARGWRCPSADGIMGRRSGWVQVQR